MPVSAVSNREKKDKEKKIIFKDVFSKPACYQKQVQETEYLKLSRQITRKP